MADSKPRAALQKAHDRLAELAAERASIVLDHSAAGRRINAAGLVVDLSRQPLDAPLQRALLDWAEATDLPARIAALLAGEPVNSTEQRPAHHSQLRKPEASQNNADVAAALAKMRSISGQLRAGEWLGASDQPITDVVNIGIGGSDLGPRMVCEALKPLAGAGPRVHFVANVDPRDLEQLLLGLDPLTTLFVISSKSFTTTETLENALSARRWLLAAMDQSALPRHTIAVSANVPKAVEFGVAENNILPMWDWVGGRYSLWSAIGLPIAIANGFEHFAALLTGAHAMDQHFASAPLEQNAPAMLALLENWHINYLNAQSVAVLPYSHDLRLLPEYLQQLTMESNGKRVDHNGEPIKGRSCATVWGSAGTIGQHSFHQLLHQGSELIPIDFVLPLHSHSTETEKQAHLVANCLAQSKALAEGKSPDQARQEMRAAGDSSDKAERLAPHRAVPGNRPNTLIAMDKLAPATLGALIALYEHKVFAQSVLWDINAFDQWGVELGKQLSGPIFSALQGEETAPSDSMTDHWVAQYRLVHE